MRACRSPSFLALAAVLCVLLAPPAEAAGKVYMRLSGPGENSHRGSTASTGAAPRIPLLKCSEPAPAPRESTGLYQITLTKEPGIGSAQLQTAWAAHQALSEITLEFFQPTRGGGEQLTYTITLINAQIVGIRQIAAGTFRDPRRQVEEIVVAFQKAERKNASAGAHGGADRGGE